MSNEHTERTMPERGRTDLALRLATGRVVDDAPSVLRASARPPGAASGSP